MQNKILYIPNVPGFPKRSEQNPPHYRHPSERKILAENIIITTPDKIKLSGWLMKSTHDTINAPTIVFFHENAGNLGTRIDYFAKYLHHMNLKLLVMAYRGYDSSEGKPNEEGISIDVKSILDFAFSRKDLNPKLIFTHGRSLGGATSVCGIVDGNFPVCGVILENTFSSIDSVTKGMFPQIFTMFNPLILKNRWDTIKRIEKITAPILFIRSLKDEIIPDEEMQKLKAKATAC